MSKVSLAWIRLHSLLGGGAGCPGPGGFSDLSLVPMDIHRFYDGNLTNPLFLLFFLHVCVLIIITLGCIEFLI